MTMHRNAGATLSDQVIAALNGAALVKEMTVNAPSTDKQHHPGRVKKARESLAEIKVHALHPMLSWY